MDDNSIMPFGKHKGKKMIDVPDEYLLWFWRENLGLFRRGVLHYAPKHIMEYIKDTFNEKDLKHEWID